MRYIGSKVLLLEYIKNVIDENTTDAKIFCDIFSGTAVVSRYFKEWYEVISNDILYFSYVLQRATIENDEVPKFESLKKHLNITDVFGYLNYVSDNNLVEKSFFYQNYSPNGGRMYLTDENALKIDAARITVEQWRNQELINDDEYFYLVACIVEGIPFVSNISGTYGAYHKVWDKRAHKRYELFKLDVKTNNKNNRSFNQDGNELIKHISGDILYIDPPYNQRQYLPNYHVLETAAKYDYPVLRGVTGIRTYLLEKSKFCLKKEVLATFTDLIANAKFRYIILSYNSEGLMNCVDIENAMKSVGKPETFKRYEIPYRRFKSRETNHNEGIHEYLFFIEKDVEPFNEVH